MITLYFHSLFQKKRFQEKTEVLHQVLEGARKVDLTWRAELLRRWERAPLIAWSAGATRGIRGSPPSRKKGAQLLEALVR